jgi:hypothetical protein
MANVKIKEQNYWILHDIGLYGIQSRSEVHGNKLKAIYKLIQKRGEPIKTNDPKIEGVMALEFGDGEYIAMKKTSYKKGHFFPCAIKTIHLKSL